MSDSPIPRSGPLAESAARLASLEAELQAVRSKFDAQAQRIDQLERQLAEVIAERDSLARQISTHG